LETIASENTTKSNLFLQAFGKNKFLLNIKIYVDDCLTGKLR